jgi:hypothetical protein
MPLDVLHSADYIILRIVFSFGLIILLASCADIQRLDSWIPFTEVPSDG